MVIQIGQTDQEPVEQKAPSLPANSPLLRRLKRDALNYSAIPKNELTPGVESAMSQLIQEVDRLRKELNAAHEKVTLLENIAEEDPLIPILNRRGFERELERTISCIDRYRTGACLLYIDVDHFKSINDTWGHRAGDNALRHTAAFLIENIRQSDTIARIGGDEFAIILLQADRAEAETKAKRLESEIEKHPCQFDRTSIPLQISIGVTDILAGDNLTGVMDRADKSMYELRALKRSANSQPSE